MGTVRNYEKGEMSLFQHDYLKKMVEQFRMGGYKTVNFEVCFKVLERVIERRFKIHKNNQRERHFEGVCVCRLCGH